MIVEKRNLMRICSPIRNLAAASTKIPTSLLTEKIAYFNIYTEEKLLGPRLSETFHIFVFWPVSFEYITLDIFIQATVTLPTSLSTGLFLVPIFVNRSWRLHHRIGFPTSIKIIHRPTYPQSKKVVQTIHYDIDHGKNFLLLCSFGRETTVYITQFPPFLARGGQLFRFSGAICETSVRQMEFSSFALCFVFSS